MSILIEPWNDDPPGPLQHIESLTAAKIRTFLFEMAEGVSNYRSLHSLTEQVEHQYHGRFLIELIQNAHDALPEMAPPGTHARIAVVLDPQDSPYGTLLVANDGQPFTRSNFERLSQLGQSDKDPQKSIGNKGLGFRSVLEVSARPEIYSRSVASSHHFDGYCFAFEPEVIASLQAPLAVLAAGTSVPRSPVTSGPIVDWAPLLLQKFSKRVKAEAKDWLEAESKYLSPYLLPVPRGEVSSPAVKALEDQGYATVVRLPLKSDEAQTLVREHMARIRPSTLLFLERVTALHMTGLTDEPVVSDRKVTLGAGDLEARTVEITRTGEDPHSYAVWTERIHIADTTDEFKAAVKALPGRWPEIEDVSVSIALRKAASPERGAFSIYLPTDIPTGSAVHINAPFFGNMSRTDVSFDDGYNKRLLNSAASLVTEVVRGQLADKGLEEARMIVDMLAPFGDDSVAADRWLKLIGAAFKDENASIADENLFLAERGWRALRATWLAPDTSRAKVIQESVLRAHATFDLFHPGLTSRRAQLLALAQARIPGSSGLASSSALAATIAQIAAKLHLEGGDDWDGFWKDVMELLPGGQSELAQHKVILGNDGQLHAASKSERVFFVPRQGTGDDSDIGGEGAPIDVPVSLQSRVAFLHESITIYEPDSRPARQTPVRLYLGGLVSQFRIEPIFATTLKDATPTLPVSLQHRDAKLCAAILKWALSIIRNAIARDRGSDAVLALLRPIPVPCRGGWYSIAEASFGTGWPSTSGEHLATYLDALPDAIGQHARDRILLPKEHTIWDGMGIDVQELLVRGGAFDGLRLASVKPDVWDSQLQTSQYMCTLPTAGPPGLSKLFWEEYKAQIEATLRGGFHGPQPYTMGPILLFPGMAELPSEDAARQALSELLLRSLPRWTDALELLPIYQTKQRQSDRRSCVSPLNFFLANHQWLAVPGEKSAIEWSAVGERWHVPADLVARRAKHFEHLAALPLAIARRLDTELLLAERLHRLGMPYLDMQSSTSSPRLLRTLIAAVGTDAAPDQNILLGQIRDAWNRFRPRPDQPAFSELAVRTDGKRLQRLVMGEGAVAYLPDLGTLASELEGFGAQVLPLHVEDARALKDWFLAAYAGRVVPTSQLRLVPYLNGEAWDGTSDERFSESALAWLIAPVLTLVAYYQQVRGIGSQVFIDKLARLREVRVRWAQNIGIAVLDGERDLLRMDVAAHWDSTRKTLLLVESSDQQAAAIATAISQAIERDDLDLPIRVLLGSRSGLEGPPHDLEAALSTLRISPDQLEAVTQSLQGDLGYVAGLAQVCLEVLAPGRDVSALLNCETHDQLLHVLAALAPADMPAEDVYQRASEARDVRDFGSAMARRYGARFELPHWNAALNRLERPLLENRDWKLQLVAHLEEARGVVKRVVAHLLLKPEPLSFNDMMAQYSALPLEVVSLARECWEVDFGVAMKMVAALLVQWPGAGPIANFFASCDQLSELRQRLALFGVDVHADPDERRRLNNQVLTEMAERLDRIRRAWWVKCDVGAVHGHWTSLTSVWLQAGSVMMGDRAFAAVFEEAELFRELRDAVPGMRTPPAFFAAMKTAQDLAGLQASLGISKADLATAQAQLDAAKAKAMRERHIIQVCGQDFDASEDNRQKLWAHLQNSIDFTRLAAAAPVDLSKAVDLAALPTRIKRSRLARTGRKSKTSSQWRPKPVDELVGLAGEIFVFEMLRRKYGGDVVTASSWLSSNSQHVFTDNEIDDGAGCDFAFSVGGRSYRVEVKASDGDAPVLTLGSSEIELAMELASARKRQRGARFLLVHVRNALSNAPDAVVLPNPYGGDAEGKFEIDRADARLTYKVAN